MYCRNNYRTRLFAESRYSNVDISEKRRPQDGRIGLKYQGKDLDIRVSCLPSTYGESIVVRLLEKSTILMNLKYLGFDENDYKRFHSIIKNPMVYCSLLAPPVVVNNHTICHH